MKFAPAFGAHRFDPRDLDHLADDPRWRAVADLLPDGVILVDCKGVIRYINPAAESIGEVASARLLNQPLSTLVQLSSVRCDVLLQVFAEGARLSTHVQDAQGRSIALDTRVLRDSSGALSCLVVIQRSAGQAPAERHGQPGRPGSAANFRSRRAAATSDMIISGEMETLFACGRRALALGARILLTGETGAGKTEMARSLHKASDHALRPFIHVNCASIPESLFESELFGYEAGAFTGALARGKRGLIEAADGGTLFLDEIGEIPLAAQAKLLRVLDDSAVQPVGSIVARRVRFQLIAATNRDLLKMAAEKQFRQDLYYRLSAVTLEVPPLRARPDLLLSLIDSFLAEVNARRPYPLDLDDTCRTALHGYDFPGNIRELQNIMEHLSVHCDTRATVHDLPIAAAMPVDGEIPVPRRPAGQADHIVPLKDAVRRFEEETVQRAIARTGSKRKAAQLLGVDVATVVRKSRPKSVFEARTGFGDLQ